MNNIKKMMCWAFAVVVFVCSVCFGFFAHAESAENGSPGAKSGSLDAYVVESCNIDITYNENNIVDVVEKYSVYFNQPLHGWTATIPLVGEFLKPDGSSVKYNARVYDVSASDKHQMLRENGNCVIKIGDPLKSVKGKKDYVLKYKYDLGRDRLTDADQIYYDLVCDHDAPYQNVTFSIALPKDFDASKLGFVAAPKGSVGGMDKVRFSVDGTKITGSYDGILAAGERLTVRCELPKGYFSRNYGGAFVCQIVVGALAVLVMIVVLFRLFAVKKKAEDFGPLVEPVEFYPPDGLNSVDVAYIYKNGAISSSNVMSLLVYLANKGYVKISSQAEDSKDFVITKVKDYDGDNESERLFFEGLFESGKNEASYEDLYNNFYRTVDLIRKKVESPAGNRFKIFLKSVLSAWNFAFFGVLLISVLTALATVFDWLDLNMVMEAGIQYMDKMAGCCVLAVVLMVAYALIRVYVDSSGGEQNVFLLLLIGVAFLLFLSVDLSEVNVNVVGIVLAVLIFALIHFLPRFIKKMPARSLLFAVLPFAVSAYVLLSDATYLLLNCVGLVCVIVTVVFACSLPQYTKYGHEITGRVRGFRNFLLTAEKEKLEALVMDDPEYFYSILPYTYVLDISDKWIKKFESIAIEKPQWYDGGDAFDVYYLDRMFWSISNHALETKSQSSSTSTSSSTSSWGSGSDGSGGAVGGGGYGGGSRGAW